MQPKESDIDWNDCPLVQQVPDLHSGDPVFVGSRLPVSAVVQNYDDFVDQGMSPDEAVAETLETYPSTPGGADAIRAVLEYRATHEPHLQP
jgi:uncharacterized protein (DUF433 family)